MINIKEEYKDILTALGKTSLAESYDFSEFDLPIVVRQLKQHYTKRKVSYDNGATKAVLFFQGLPFIIKISFTLGGDGYELQEPDYCSIEEETYCIAKQEQVKDFFAGIEYIGKVERFNVYAQDLAICAIAENSKNPSKESIKSAKEIMDKNSMWLNDEWSGNALDFFGKEKFDNFLSFIVNNEINDLHKGNVGYIGDRPVLIDYSGFFG